MVFRAPLEARLIPRGGVLASFLFHMSPWNLPSGRERMHCRSSLRDCLQQENYAGDVDLLAPGFRIVRDYVCVAQAEIHRYTKRVP